MATRIVPYSTDHEPAVRAFNERLRNAQSEWVFPETSNRRRDDTTDSYYFEDFVVLDDDGVVRGGYILKNQNFWLEGDVLPISNYTLPLSEGIIDKKYGMVGVSMILDAQKKKDYLFDLGLGSLEAPSAKVMKGVGWSLAPVPFQFRVIRAGSFLRNIVYVRTTPPRRLALDVLAFSGLGALGNGVRTLLKRRVESDVRHVQVERVDRFGGWADDVWKEGRSNYGFTAVRDAETLNALYPGSNENYIRLKVSRDGKPIGWALVLSTRMADHKQFGSMKLGSIADCFSASKNARAVMYAADKFLGDDGVDLIVSNQSNDAWCAALRTLGYLDGPSNFILTTSKNLSARLGSLEAVLGKSHFNRGDGDGPIHL